ncbi:MAG: cation:proton antiporter [Clostridia bacterium]|nr:cation:proton antiporter [Clostridia bacterium]
METLLTLSIALIAGMMMTRVVKPLKLPAVTAYLIAGVLVGPYCLGLLKIAGLGFISHGNVEQFSIISDVALGFIAFAIGNEFRLSQLRETGRQATIVGIVQALFATLFVDIALILLHFAVGDILPLPSAIILGAIATATAPAATLMVVRQYKAKGKLTDILLPVVALDDAVGLVVFAVSFGIAEALGSGRVDAVSIVLEPIIEIVLSLILGAAMGYILTQLEKLFNSNSNRLTLVISIVILTVALSMMEFDFYGIHIGFSSLLVCMMLGTVFCNICPVSFDLMERADKWTVPLNALFFVISGAELELSVFAKMSVVLIGIVYIISRSLGKYVGAYVSCELSKCDETVKKYLGITLLPQAGVALGMCVTVSAKMGENGSLIRNIVLFAVLIYELFGPVMTKNALMAAGDIKPKSEEVLNRRKARLEEGKLRKPVKKA